MSALGLEYVIFTEPDGRILGAKPYKIKIREGEFVDVVITSTLNGVPISDIFPIINTISTTDATTTTISTIPITNNSTYTITATVVGASSIGDSVFYKASCKVNNIAGTLSALTIFDATKITDASLAATSVSFVTSTTNVLVQVNGIAATDINWKGYRDAKFVAF